MDKEILVLSASNVVLEPIQNDDTTSLSNVSELDTEKTACDAPRINNLTNGTTITNGIDPCVSKTVNGTFNGNSNPPTNAKNTPRNSKGFNACKTEWVRLNIGNTSPLSWQSK